MRLRRRFTIDLSDPMFDAVLMAAGTMHPDVPVRDALVEFILRGAGVDPEPAAVAVARRVAFAAARAEASALLAELGRKLSVHARDATGAALAELQAEVHEAAAERTRAREEAVRQAAERLRLGR